MREIKFRAWDGKKMHKVCRLGLHGFSTDLWSPSPVACDARFTDDLKIMQFTGLKDRTGKEIYEGDIVKDCFVISAIGDIPEEPRTPPLTVKIPEFFYSIEFNGYDESDLEVIGNIYENPELLK